MSVLYWEFSLMAWFGAGVYVIAAQCSKLDHDQIPNELKRDLSIFVGVSGLVFFILVPVLAHQHFLITHWIHHAAIFGLFVFLLAGQALQVEGWIKLKGGKNGESLFSTYNRFWWLTSILPAPIAVAILTSGLGLICQDAISDPTGEVIENYSLRSGWLFCLVALFGLFFWDGIFGYSVAAQDMRRYWADNRSPNVPLAGVKAGFEGRWRDLQLLAHFLSFPFVFVFGALRYPSQNIIGPFIMACEKRLTFLPHGLPQAIVALGVWLVMGGVIFLLRRAISSRR